MSSSSAISSVSAYTASVATDLQRLADVRRQQSEIDIQVGESIRQARQRSAEQSMQDTNKQAELVNEIRKAAMQARGAGGIDVWA